MPAKRCERKADKEIQIKFFSKDNPTLAISDNGEGILPTVLDKIFVPFFTTKTSRFGYRIEPVQTDHGFA